jgi:adenylosuccinate synthase
MAGELFYPDKLRAHLKDLMDWKNLILTGVYGAEPYRMEMLEKWLDEYCSKIKPFVCDTGAYLREAQNNGNSSGFSMEEKTPIGGSTTLGTKALESP